jgi:hypothetical protein
MKRYQKYLAITGFSLFVATCVSIVGITHPDSAPVNSVVEVSLDVEVAPAETETGKILVGILAPETWSLAENAEVTYTTSLDPDVVKTMSVATSANLAPSGKPWAASLRDSLGTQDNYEPVEWIAFIADEDISYENLIAFTGTVHISFTAGDQNLKTNLAYVVTSIQDAADVDVRGVRKVTFETTGGENAMIDYTQPKVCSVTPETFTWEDIVAVHFNLSLGDSPLKGADKVYMMARATYSEGTQEVVVDEVSEKTLLLSEGTDKWVLYIYPHEFFDIPAGETIGDVGFHLVNEDKSIVVKMSGDVDFSVPENNK